ncbi:hypothetical protein [Cryptosporangium phraense]|uniref:Uncharacterized protein n=1 Tax=Cryptosporangium phraense TaxID=2593070 RepID=A0A545ANE9_9ACTN|nr:hypothetical protein [Cryptosporangium phraense]TQS42847.1 hypothetical protein FL583_22620 [Cryptosporangium phraense]
MLVSGRWRIEEISPTESSGRAVQALLRLSKDGDVVIDCLNLTELAGALDRIPGAPTLAEWTSADLDAPE